jgi:hypothetical protein
MTAQLLFDKLAYIDRLKFAGIDEHQARAHAEGLDYAFREEVATKRDLAELEVAIKSDLAELKAATKSDLAELKVATKSDLAEFKVATKSDLAELKTEIEKSKNTILPTIITIAFALLGAMKYLP